MRIAVVHNAVIKNDTRDDQDVLTQAAAVIDALECLGHEAIQLECDLNLEHVRKALSAIAPDLVFNLVESLAGTGRLIQLFPSLLDAMGLAYTGASAEAIFLTSNKILAKKQLQGAGLSTPKWIGPFRCGRPLNVTGNIFQASHWIIKSVWEHASIGLDDGAIVDGRDVPRLKTTFAQRAIQLGGDGFAEVFIQGREFNLSVLDGTSGPTVLPPAEIIFEGFEENRPHIVGYDAKWVSDSFAYSHTPRCFDFNGNDQELLDRLQATALKCWELFELRGYARIDFRVDDAQRPWVLEVNANPCLSPDAGFAAAIQQADLSFEDAVSRIIEAATPKQI